MENKQLTINDLEKPKDKPFFRRISKLEKQVEKLEKQIDRIIKSLRR